MLWDDIKIFLAVAHAGSLASAARRLRQSQATVWRRMRSLEQALGADLFERRSTGYVLTAQGTTFLRALAGVGETIASARRRLKEGDLVEGEVRLVLPESLVMLVAERASTLAQRHPRLQLEIVSASPIAELGVRDADITLRVEKPLVGGFWISDVHPLSFAVYAAPSYLSRHGAPRSLDALAGHRVIAFDHSIAHVAPERWRHANMDGTTVVLRASSPHARLSAVRAGLGLALLPCCFVGNDPSLQSVFGPEVVGSVDTYLCVNTELTGQARIAETVRFVSETLRAASLVA